MPHIRTSVRNAVIARLKTISGLKLVCSFGRTARSFQTNEIPVAVVRVNEVTAPVGKVRPRAISRDMSVVIDLIEAADDDVDTYLDDLSALVEQVLANPSDLGIGPLTDWRLSSTSSQNFALGDSVYGSLALTYAASVSTLEGNPTSNAHK